MSDTAKEQSAILDYHKPEPPKTDWRYLGLIFGVANLITSVGLAIYMAIEIGHAITSNTARYAMTHALQALALLVGSLLAGILAYFFIRANYRA